jgi:hypothetical protein
MSITRRQVLTGAAAGLAAGVTLMRREADAAGFTLRVSFGGFGAVALDPTQPGSGKPATKSKQVHLIAASSLDHPRHYTRLRVLKKNLPAPPVSNENFVEWDLRDAELRIEGATVTNGVTVSAASEAPLCPGPAGVWDHIDLLGNLARNGGGKGRINDACLAMDPPGVVAARVLLNDGSLRAIKPFEPGYANRAWEMKFENGQGLQGSQTRSIAETVEASLTIAQSCTLKITPFARPKELQQPDPISIRIISAPGETQAVIMVTNHPSSETHATGTVPVRHFITYFDLLRKEDRPKGDRPFPHPAKNGCIDAATKTGKTAFCPGALVFTA